MWDGVVWYGAVWHGAVWYGEVRYGMAWRGMACFISALLGRESLRCFQGPLERFTVGGFVMVEIANSF